MQVYELVPPSAVEELLAAGRRFRHLEKWHRQGFRASIEEFSPEFVQFALDVLSWSEEHPGYAFRSMVEYWSQDTLLAVMDGGTPTSIDRLTYRCRI